MRHKPDKYYEENTTTFRSQNDELKRLTKWLDFGQPVIIVGETGCGKTTCVKSLNRPFITVSGADLYKPQDLLGQNTLKGGDTIFLLGPALEAIEKDVFLYIDEIHQARPEALNILKSLLDQRRYLEYRGKIWRAGKGFGIVGSGVPPLKNFNPELRQRFTFIEIQYLPPKEEADLIATVSGIPLIDAEFLVKVGTQTRKAHRSLGIAGASTRALILAANGMKLHDWSRNQAVEQLLLIISEKSAHQELYKILISHGLYTNEALLPRSLEQADLSDLLDENDQSLTA